MAVREGTCGKNYDIEAQIQGSEAGIAFHVQDATQPRHVHIKASGDELEVWVYLVGDWQCAVHTLYERHGVLSG